MTLRQRAPRHRDDKHLAFVRSQPCCVCGSRRDVEAAHLRMACAARGKPPTGMQEKPSDAWVTPLCAYHHRTGVASQHESGERQFWIDQGRDPFVIALMLWELSGGAARAEQPQHVKAPKKILPRVDRSKRQKITGRSAIVSAGFPNGLRKRMDGTVEKRT